MTPTPALRRITHMRRAIVVVALLTATAAFAQGQPDLVISASQDTLVLPGLPTPIEVRYFNGSPTVPATATYITLTSIQPFVSAPADCTIGGNHVTCRVGTVPPSGGGDLEVRTLELAVETPQSGSRFEIVAQISSREADAESAPARPSAPSPSASRMRARQARRLRRRRGRGGDRDQRHQRQPPLRRLPAVVTTSELSRAVEVK